MAQEATLENWMTPPRNQWAFHNIPKVLKTETAPHDPSRTTDLPHHLQNDKVEAAFNLPLPSQAQPLDAKTWLEQTGTDAVIVLKDGNLVYETYARGNDKHSQHILFSVSKSICGLLLGIMVDKAQKSSNPNIKLDSTIEEFFPGQKVGKTWTGVTLRECIDMASGVQFPEGTPEARAAGGWMPPLPGVEPQTIAGQLLAMGDARSPEKNFWYSSANNDMVGIVLSRVKGTGLGQVLSEELWKPMGAETDAAVTVDSAGDGRAAGGFCCSARDLARIGQVMLEGGKGVVPEWWVEDTLRGGDVQAWMNGQWGKLFEQIWGEKVAYRNAFYVQREEVILCLGIFGQTMRIDVKNKTVVVKLSSQEDRVNMEMMGLNLRGVEHLAEIVANMS